MEEASADPWWYRVPPVAVSLITLSIVAIAVFTLGSGAETTRLYTALGIGLATGLGAAFVHGMAQRRHDQGRR